MQKDHLRSALRQFLTIHPNCARFSKAQETFRARKASLGCLYP